MNLELGLSIKVETYSCFEVEIYQQGARTPLAGEYARSRPSLQIEQNYESRLAGDVFPKKKNECRNEKLQSTHFIPLGLLISFPELPPSDCAVFVWHGMV